MVSGLTLMPSVHFEFIFAFGIRKWSVHSFACSCPIFPIPYIKINSKWIKDLNVRPATIKILEDNTSNNFFDIGTSNFFLDMFPEARVTKQKKNMGMCGCLSG